MILYYIYHQYLLIFIVFLHNAKKINDKFELMDAKNARPSHESFSKVLETNFTHSEKISNDNDKKNKIIVHQIFKTWFVSHEPNSISFQK